MTRFDINGIIWTVAPYFGVFYVRREGVLYAIVGTLEDAVNAVHRMARTLG